MRIWRWRRDGRVRSPDGAACSHMIFSRSSQQPPSYSCLSRIECSNVRLYSELVSLAEWECDGIYPLCAPASPTCDRVSSTISSRTRPAARCELKATDTDMVMVPTAWLLLSLANSAVHALSGFVTTWPTILGFNFESIQKHASHRRRCEASRASCHLERSPIHRQVFCHWDTNHTVVVCHAE